MPVYSGISIGIFFAALGLPGLCGFIGEVLVVLSVWNYSMVLAVIAASVVILTAGYILWTIQRVYLGPEYKGPHGEALTPMTRRELAIAAPLLALAISSASTRRSLLNYMTPSVKQDGRRAWPRGRERSSRSVASNRAERQSSRPLEPMHVRRPAAVNFFELVQNSLRDTLGPSLAAFRPELVAVRDDRRAAAGADALAAAGTAAPYLVDDRRACWPRCGWPRRGSTSPATAPRRRARSSPACWSYDTFSVYMRGLLLLFVLLLRRRSRD